MSVRRAKETDIPRLKELLLQVLNVHAKERPDLFIPNTTKYSSDELRHMIANEETPIFVIEDEEGVVAGYAMCEIHHRLHSENMTDILTVFIDDLCVDEIKRNGHYGSRLYAAVKDFARKIGAYHVTLNVWTCNEPAIGFYRAMGLTPMEYVMEEIL